jgi:hypothetical protein
MFKLFTNNRGNNSIHFDNYNFRYFRTNKSSGDIVWRCMQKTCSETIITNNEKTVLVRSNIKDHQHDEDNDKQKKELQTIRTAIKRKAIENEAIQRKCDREREANVVYQYSLLLTNKLTIMEYIEKTSLNFKPI